MYKQETKEYKAQATVLYNYLKEHHLGAENAITKAALASILGISERVLRDLTRLINTSPDYEKLVSTSHSCFMCATKEECEKAVRSTFRAAVSLIKKGQIMAKKVGLNNQIRLSIGGENYDIIKTFSESENENV